MPLVRQPDDPKDTSGSGGSGRSGDPKKPADKKDELLRELSDVEPAVQQAEELGQEIVRSARFVRDVAGPIRDVFLRVPPDALSEDDWSRQLDGWRTWNHGAGELQKFLPTMVNTFGALSTGVTNTSTQAISVVIQRGGLPPEIGAAASRLWQTLERSPLADKARASMERLRLCQGGGTNRTPLDLLNESQAALEHPAHQDSSPASVLLPLRECLNRVLAELVRRRPKQERAGRASEKVVSVARQCGRPELPGSHFERIGSDADALLDEFSAAKQATMSREEVTAKFNRGVLLLNALMDGIDESLLREP